MKNIIIIIFLVNYFLVSFAQDVVLIEAPDVRVAVGNEFAYPITVIANENNLAALSFTIDYNTELFEIDTVILADGWFNNPPNIQDGVVSVSTFTSKPENDTVDIVNITFETKGQSGQIGDIELNVNAISNIGGITLPYQISNGKILINGCDPNLIGTSCNDDNDCTANDVYDSNCECIGTIQDADNDGICDAKDQCPGENDSVIGTSCNDGDDCTVNDVYDSNCICEGIFQDKDNDSICDALDNCPNFDNNQIGNTCDDGDICTEDDIITNNCTCEGIYQDEDNDGICDALDVEPEPTECNLILNHDFSAGQQNWDTYVSSSASASFNMNEGYADFTITNGSTHKYKVQLFQSGFQLAKGKTYKVSFKAKASADKTIYVHISNSTDNAVYHYVNKTIGTNWTTIDFNFTMNDATDENGRVIFGFGQSAVDVAINDVVIKASDCDTCVIGATCDDGNSCTYGDTFTDNCACVGIPIPNCNTCRYTDSLALIAIYNGFNGSVQWDLTQPINTWKGIGLNADGCVDWINIQEKNITGILAPEIGNLSEITYINFHENKISGKIPTSIGKLTNLKTYNMDDNSLNGNIPSSIGNLTNLNYLDLGRNDLGGSIPTSIVNLNNLNTLYLHNNEITGSLPAWLSNLNTLASFQISNNQLSGCYDVSLTQLCNQLTIGTTNRNISDGNNFDASWEDFCSRSKGVCGSVLNPAECNLIQNNDFSEGQQNWDTFVSSSANASLNTNEGNANFTISNGGIKKYKVQLFQTGFQLEQGKTYEVSFKAKAALGKTIYIQISNIADNLQYNYTNETIATNWSTVSFTFVMNNPTDNNASIIFGLGQSAIDIAIDDVVVQASDCNICELGAACDDGNSCTTGDKFTNDCACIGTPIPNCNNRIVQNYLLNVNNYPNPFTNETTIEYTLPTAQPVSLFITDMMGKKVATLLNNEQQTKGQHMITFEGSHYPAGMYYYSLQVGDLVETQKMILMK